MMKELFSLSILFAVLLLVMGCGEKVSVEEMFVNANQFQKEGHYEEAIKVYQKLLKDFSGSDYCPKAQFMIGFIYANEIKDFEKAKEAYQKFVKNYPDHDMAKDAEWEIEHLGRDINEIEELTKVQTDSSQ